MSRNHDFHPCKSELKIGNHNEFQNIKAGVEKLQHATWWQVRSSDALMLHSQVTQAQVDRYRYPRFAHGPRKAETVPGLTLLKLHLQIFNEASRRIIAFLTERGHAGIVSVTRNTLPRGFARGRRTVKRRERKKAIRNGRVAWWNNSWKTYPTKRSSKPSVSDAVRILI